MHLHCLPESCSCHHVAHTHVHTLIVPLISRHVLSAPQCRRQVLTECDSLDLGRYQAARGLENLLIGSLCSRQFGSGLDFLKVPFLQGVKLLTF